MQVVLAIVVLLLAAFGALALIGIVWAWVEQRRAGDDEWGLDDDDDDGGVRAAVAELMAELDWWDMTPEALEAQPAFRRGVEELADEDTPVESVVQKTRDPSGWLASMALAALVERDDVPEEWVTWALRHPARPSNVEDAFLLRALAEHASGRAIPPVLAAHESIRHELIAEFIGARQAAGEEVDAETFAGVSIGAADEIEAFVHTWEVELGADFREAFEEWRAAQNLANVGRIWDPPFDRPATLLAGRRRELVELVVSALEQTPPRSVLLVGEHGVGKTALARAALDRLETEPTVFETTAAQLNAGAIYIGELEGRVKTLVQSVAGQDVVWVLPELQETLFAGQHMRSPQGLLDALLPHVESGAITLLAEATPTAVELLVAARPRVASAFEIVRVRPLDEAETIAVARHALEQDALAVATDDETLAEAFELAQQFMPGVAPPGNLLRLLHATAAEAVEHGAESFDGTDVLATLAAGSGLPLALLDPGAALPLADVRAFFERRVLEQPEAVDSVVERIAMIKAGLTDPTRPLGVFLFVGPTGTGKTEIAKSLAAFLFGSADRLVRLDMSEYQTPESLERLLSDTTHEQRGAALVSSVRKDPFSVLLLDEFEKAAAPIWDLFLQVFDDGRLTDLQGRVVDFRRCVIVLTSNIGSPLARGPSVGFEPSARTFSAAGIERAIRSSFRPEFLNRLDRVVIFRPFERSAMRALLDKELAEALARRGLRGRPWAVEVDESAYAFLIDKGFSPELGARPLKRAVERYLLAPLAAAIVEQSVPEGDQFLFVTASDDDAIDVTFVDPDAEHVTTEVEEQPSLDLRSIARSGGGGAASVRFVLDELARIGAEVEKLQARKGHALSVVSEPGFWEREDRFEILAEAEYLDRLGAAAATAERLGTRLMRSVRGDGEANAELVELLANRLYVLDRAVAGLAVGAPTEVCVQLRPTGTERGPEAEPFATLLAEMYVAWARKRGMRLERVEDSVGEHLLAVSGLGCGEILGGETGIHVLEHVDGHTDDADRIVDREQVRVRVVPLAPGPAGGSAEVARSALEAAEDGDAPTHIVRRYRPGKAPLVRDAVRGYRTGRLDRVLAGDFDLY